MADRRDLNLEKYNISKNAYRELYYFCKQYSEKKNKLKDLRSGFTGKDLTDMPKGTDISDPTYSRGNAAAQLSTDIELIEQTAILADKMCDMGGQAYAPLLDNIAGNVPYSELIIPCGKNKFTEIRYAFFFYLAKAKSII